MSKVTTAQLMELLAAACEALERDHRVQLRALLSGNHVADRDDC